MAFPTVVATTATDAGSDTTPTFTINSGRRAGDLLVAIMRADAGTAVAWPGGWTELVDSTADASNDVTSIAYRWSDGTEADVTPTVTSGLKACGITIVIRGAHPTTAPQIAAAVTGTSTTPDPGSVTPSGGTLDYLFIWAGAWEGEQTSPPASNPTNYSANVTGANTGTAGAVTTNARCAIACRALNTGAAEDPGSWTISVSDDWTAYTLCVHPAPDPTPEIKRPVVVGQAVARAAVR